MSATGYIAAKHNRRFTMIEKEEYYVKWILKRFEGLQQKLF